jgi:DNA-directed RNA polymerase subunit RPC12/RpoP
MTERFLCSKCGQRANYTPECSELNDLKTGKRAAVLCEKCSVKALIGATKGHLLGIDPRPIRDSLIIRP